MISPLFSFLEEAKLWKSREYHSILHRAELFKKKKRHRKSRKEESFQPRGLISSVELRGRERKLLDALKL